MRPQGYLLLAISIPNFILGSFILLRNLKDRANTFFAAFTIFVGLWSLGLAGFIFSRDSSVALWWAKEYYAAAALIAFSFLGFSLNFTNRARKFTTIQKLLALIPVAAILAMIFADPSLMLAGIRYHEWGKEVILNRVGYSLYSLYFILYVSLGFIVIVNAWRKAIGIQKIYLRYILTGLTVAFGLGATFNLFYPAFGNYKYIWVGPLFTLVYVSTVSYAIIRHKLFDVRLIVARSIGYALSIFFIGSIYGLFAFNIINKFAFDSSEVTLTQQVVYTILAVSIAFTFQPLKRFFDRVTNKLFYRDAYEPQVLIDQLNKVLVGNIELEKLLLQSSSVIGSTLKSEFCLFGIKEVGKTPRRLIGDSKKEFLDEDIKLVRSTTPRIHTKVIVTDELTDSYRELQNILRKYDIAAIARLTDTPTKNTEGLGYIILGAKKSGNPYSSQDTKMLEIIADELVIAIQNALRFEEIQNFASTLQEKVDEATRNLRKANEKLKQMDQTKDDFISMASHQLRTPLTSVKGYVSMVMEGDAGKINAGQKKLLDQAFVSSQRMVYLIADLLNVSRLRTGKFIIEPKATNLADVIEGEISQLIETAKGRDLELTYHKPKEFPMLMLDETKIRQVIMNFADNAIYYTPAGGHIAVNVVDKGESVEFTVVDDGIGVPKTEQHHLFSKFYRAGNAKKARPDGTGLGLFMAKKVIVAQGGSLIFNSQEGKGSTFGFSFAKAPLSPEHFKMPKDAVSPPAMGQPAIPVDRVAEKAPPAEKPAEKTPAETKADK